MLMCVILGYHGSTSYQWIRGDQTLTEETYPVIYVSQRGNYVCVCNFKEVTVKLNFNVSGGKNNSSYSFHSK